MNICHLPRSGAKQSQMRPPRQIWSSSPSSSEVAECGLPGSWLSSQQQSPRLRSGLGVDIYMAAMAYRSPSNGIVKLFGRYLGTFSPWAKYESQRDAEMQRARKWGYARATPGTEAAEENVQRQIYLMGNMGVGHDLAEQANIDLLVHNFTSAELLEMIKELMAVRDRMESDRRS